MILRWTDGMMKVVESCRSAPLDGPAAAELAGVVKERDALLEELAAVKNAAAFQLADGLEERDALMEELAAFKDAVRDVGAFRRRDIERWLICLVQMEASETRARHALSTKTTEKETLEIVYNDICKEVIVQREVSVQLRCA